jgi:hypothetical protein
LTRESEITVLVTAFLVLCPLGLWAYLAAARLRNRLKPLTQDQLGALREKYPDAATGYEIAERFSKEHRLPRRRTYALFPDAFLESKLLPQKPRKPAPAAKPERSRGKR